MTSVQTSTAPSPAARSWIGRGLIASGRGIALTGLILAELGLLCALAIAVTFAAVGVGLFFIPGLVTASRAVANTIRRLAGEWCGVPIAVPYLPAPTAPGGDPGLWRRYGWLLNDPATWRDLLWMTVDSLVGWALTLTPAGLVAWGLFGVVMPAVWHPIVGAGGNNWYAFIHVTGAGRAWLSVPLGVVFILAGLWAGPPLLSAYGRFARRLLAPASRVQLERRVRRLAETRSVAVEAGAAEVRRIERDLHDGAQARLVAMGMTLDAADQLLDDNPAAARVLLTEARETSVKALAELRDLVRGIHPPVLADRGLADAIRALALDSPVQVQVAAALPDRPEPPVESAAYFAVSELLTNVTKHAGARQARVDVRHDGGILRIEVRDNGSGGADATRGSGLAGIQRRLGAFDGTMTVSSPPGGPTVVTLEIPCALSSPKTSTS
ncbi:MAG TPA: sensor histidine kinase [Streptosporangiaceae bacterium]|jgi:signal transduction histidine kinase|nr:sensor histidine kinase [Streptosporangiaceae bacterium]